MAIVAPPPELMTVTAQRLLRAAEALGLPASVVVTTSDGPLGLGFIVPDEVALWDEVKFTATVIENGEPGDPFVAVTAEVPEEEEPEKQETAAPVKKTGRGPRKATEGSEA